MPASRVVQVSSHNNGLVMTDIEQRLIWNPPLEGDVACAVVCLINSTVDDGGTLGHAEPMTELAASRFLAQLTRGLDAGDVQLLLGFAGAEPTFMVMMTQSLMPNCRHTAELSKGVVHPHWRGRRLVEAAFRALVERAELSGVEQFVLDVREESRAHALWQRFGFVSYGVLEDYARVGGRVHRGHYMAQSVQSLRRRISPTNHSSIRKVDDHATQ